MAFISSELNQLLVYRDLLKDGIIKELQSLTPSSNQSPKEIYDLAAKLIVWAEDIGLAGNLAENYFIYKIAKSQTAISSLAEKYNGKIGDSLFQAAVHDAAILKKTIKKGWQGILPDIVLSGYQPSRPLNDDCFAAFKSWFSADYTPQELVNKLIGYYAKMGSGDMASYRAFRWTEESGLTGVKYVDSICFEDLVGYERQKEELITNTKSFLAGKPANNVLLSGARGTGKSSSIKALINQFFIEGLRLVEISKGQFKELPGIMNTLRQINKKFILFLDDLSFEEFETEYKHLKSLIDGGIDRMPDNVLIYATSNRRHLIRETWADRSGSANEVHTQDTVNEKISLSDRFGITIYYPSPGQNEYFEIVEGLARKNSIDLSKEELLDQAVKWEMCHSGRSGRVARQFIDYLAGQKTE